MKYHSKDVQLLLLSLSIFSAAVGLIHAVKSSDKQSKDGLNSLSVQDAIWHLSLLISSRSVEKIAESLSQTSAMHAQKILQSIIQDQESALHRNDKLELIFAIALQYHGNIKKQGLFFELIFKNSVLYHTGAPVLFVAAQSNYQRIIPALLEWLQEYSEHTLDEVIKEVLWYVIKENKFKEFVLLHDYGVFITPELATELLWHAIDNNNTGEFVPLLVQSGANLEYIHNNKHTFFTRATELNNYTMVKALLQEIAQFTRDKKKMSDMVNKVVDPAIGSALQIAIQKKFGNIDMLLREYGARE